MERPTRHRPLPAPVLAFPVLLLLAGRVSGAEALQIGLVDQLVEHDDLRDAAMQLAQEIAENAPLAVMSVRATMRAGLADAVSEATEHELKEQQWLRATQDAYEGIRAVAERRPGNFTGTFLLEALAYGLLHLGKK